MKTICTFFLLMCASLCSLQASPRKEVVLKIVETSDVHGHFFPYDFIQGKPAGGSMARVYQYVTQQRRTYGDRLLLLDNGDILQGQPSVYHANYMDTTGVHFVADVLNYMQYDAVTIGNHDVEAGPAVYHRWMRDTHCPVLGANVLNTETCKPALKPYHVFEREGVKIAVLGMITPAIPNWLPENLWPGLNFQPMVDCAKLWVPYIQEVEQPDILIGLFHSGKTGQVVNGIIENASRLVAEQVPGFDLVLMGHDHQTADLRVTNPEGKEVLLLNPANNARYVAEATFTLTLEDGKVIDKQVAGQIVSTDAFAPHAAFEARYATRREVVEKFVSRPIGQISQTISTRDAYFGSSAFVDLIHNLQLAISGAQVSFVAPLSFAAEIRQGTIHMSDMFNLYKFENLLYVMNLTGQEIKDYLEYSYDIWTVQMQSPDDPLFRLKKDDRGRTRFAYPSYNFDSAAGLRYTVDVRQPKGQKITIESLADGSPFSLTQTYKVALNSYRGNGGGDLLTVGAGIPREELKSRVVWSTEKDLRFYLMKHIEKLGTLHPAPLHQWKFVPEDWAHSAAQRDRKLLFGR